VRRVSNAVNISGVSNDKRMFTRVQTHPDSLLFLFATDCEGRAFQPGVFYGHQGFAQQLSGFTQAFAFI